MGDGWPIGGEAREVRDEMTRRGHALVIADAADPGFAAGYGAPGRGRGDHRGPLPALWL